MDGMNNLIGVNLFSIRQHCTDLESLDRSLGRLKDIGYPSVQVSGLGSLTAEQVRPLLDKHGLKACASHDSLKDLSERPGWVADKLETLGCDFTALGFPGGDAFTAERWPGIGSAMTAAGRVLAARGLRLGYHNHAQEFGRYDHRTFLAALYDDTPADVVFAELDTYWAQVGGASPASWIRRLKGRLPAVHLKDFFYETSGPRFCEVGHGNLDWDEIFTACREAGTRIFIVEQDDPFPGRDIFDSLAMSLKTVQKFV